MNRLHADLAYFARTIVQQQPPSAQVATHYAHYSQQTGIGVYRNNYQGNLHDALSGAYPVAQQLVGAAFFRMLAARFIEQTPSRSANLHHYGSELADFIRGFAPARDLVYLADVAALEWACHTAYFEPEAEKLDFGQLADIPAEHHARLVFQLHPATRIVRSPYPIHAIWHAHQPGAPEDFQIDIASGPAYTLVCRPLNNIEVIELSAPEADWLQHTQAGNPLGIATMDTLERHPDFDLQALLLKLVQHAALSGFTLKD